jgi:glucose uptake protein GlcU
VNVTTTDVLIRGGVIGSLMFALRVVTFQEPIDDPSVLIGSLLSGVVISLLFALLQRNEANGSEIDDR